MIPWLVGRDVNGLVHDRYHPTVYTYQKILYEETHTHMRMQFCARSHTHDPWVPTVSQYPRKNITRALNYEDMSK